MDDELGSEGNDNSAGCASDVDDCHSQPSGSAPRGDAANRMKQQVGL